jgi:hypothetical protein
MAFEIPPFIKEHPYAVGSVVIVGGIIVFYLLSGSSSGGATSASSNQAAILQADEAEAQVNAGTQQADAQTSAQLQAAQDQQEETDEQTQASVNIQNSQTAAQLAASIYNTQGSVATSQSDNNAAIIEGANAEISNQNVYAMQESELEDQINSGVVENANDNATAVAGAQIQAGVTDLGIGDATTIASQQTQDAYNLDLTNDEAYDAEIPTITQDAGQQKNSLIDATDQTSLFQTILAQGNPGVAAAGTSASASADKNANTTTAAQTASIASGITSIGNAVSNGLFS